MLWATVSEELRVTPQEIKDYFDGTKLNSSCLFTFLVVWLGSIGPPDRIHTYTRHTHDKLEAVHH